MQEPARLKIAAALTAPRSGTLEVRARPDPSRPDLALKIDALGWRPSALSAPGAETAARRPAGGAGRLSWQAGDAPALNIALERGELTALKLSTPDAPAATPPLATLERLEIEAGKIDLNARQAEIGRLRLQQPRTRLERDAQGRLNLADWLATPPAASTSAPPKAPAAVEPSTPGWSLRLGTLQIEDGRLGWRDLQPEDDVALEIERLQLGVQDLQWRGDRLGAPLRSQLAADLRGEGGTRRAGPTAPVLIDARGQLALEPLAVSARLKLQALPLHLLAPYAPPMPGVELVRARLGWDGELTLRQPAAGLQLALRGDGRLADLQLHTRQRASSASTEGDDGAELLSWQTLSLQGLDVALQPGTRPKVSLRETALDGLFARLMITPEGRSTCAMPASGRSPYIGAGICGGLGSIRAGRAAGRSRHRPDPAEPRAHRLRGPLHPPELQRRPRRAARPARGLAQRLARDGHAGAGRQGRAHRRPAISGRLQPLASPPALDIQARANDIELAPLSPYSGKYAGYGIERGKLGMDVALPHRRRRPARRQQPARLNQLTFGDRSTARTRRSCRCGWRWRC